MIIWNLNLNFEFKNDLDQHLAIINEHFSLALEIEGMSTTIKVFISKGFIC